MGDHRILKGDGGGWTQGTVGLSWSGKLVYGVKTLRSPLKHYLIPDKPRVFALGLRPISTYNGTSDATLAFLSAETSSLFSLPFVCIRDRIFELFCEPF